MALTSFGVGELNDVTPADIQDISNPPQPGQIRDITLTALANIINDRKRWPGYRSDLVISPELEAYVGQYASNYRSRGSLSIPPPPPDAISDDIAVRALFRSNQNLPIPLMFSPSQNDMRRKTSFPSTPMAFSAYPNNVRGLSASIRGVGPIMVRSLSMLSPFGDDSSGDPSVQIESAPVDNSSPADTSSVDNSGVVNGSGPSFGSGILAALPSLVQAGTGIYSAVNPQRSPSPVYINPLTGQASAPGSSNNMTPILLLGGLALVAFFMMSKSGKRR